MAKVKPVRCFGCRAKHGDPAIEDDTFPVDLPGAKWERFECEECGVEDVRLREDN